MVEMISDRSKPRTLTSVLLLVPEIKDAKPGPGAPRKVNGTPTGASSKPRLGTEARGSKMGAVSQVLLVPAAAKEAPRREPAEPTLCTSTRRNGPIAVTSGASKDAVWHPSNTCVPEIDAVMGLVSAAVEVVV
jgi:hypothetical protein